MSHLSQVCVVVLDGTGNKWHPFIPRRDVLLRCPSSALGGFQGAASRSPFP